MLDVRKDEAKCVGGKRSERTVCLGGARFRESNAAFIGMGSILESFGTPSSFKNRVECSALDEFVVARRDSSAGDSE